MSREMKDSGFEWIGEIPEDWKLIRLCNMTKSIFLGKTPVYSEKENENYIVGQKNNQANGVDFTDIKYGEDEFYSQREEKEFLRYGDVLLNTLGGGSVGRIGYWNIKNNKKYITDGHLMVIRAKENCDSKFLYYAMVSQQKKLEDDAVGSTNQAFLTITQVYKNVIASTDYEMQNKIARFLDEKLKKIDFIMKKIEKSVENYKKLKQSIITQAVTKGIVPERLMKECDINWIGVIPEEWKITQLRHCASVRSGITLGKTYSKETELVEMPYLRVANVQDGYVDTNDIAVLRVSKNEMEKYSLSAGEVLMTEGGDRDKLGRGCVWDGRITPCLHQNHIFAVKVKEKLLNPYYLEYLTASSVGRTYFDVTAVKTTNLACTSSSKVLAFTIPLPSIDEQNEIVAYLKEKCGCIENIISKKEQFIDELENYKKSLIYEYVTGKKEVPES